MMHIELLDQLRWGTILISILILVSVIVFVLKKDKKEKEKRRIEYLKEQELVKQNKRINNLEQLIWQYPTYDKVDKKLTKLSVRIDELQEIMDKKELKEYEWIRQMNEKLSILERTILKYTSLNGEEQKEVKLIVLEMIKKIKNEIKEKQQSESKNQTNSQKERFEKRLKELEKLN